ncbi:MAG: DUF4910 domain-containing protein [Ardenticatenaceae bacterium]|nr:DUF4910 domain-containing protein [Ardenticatenaceae bacterium]
MSDHQLTSTIGERMMALISELYPICRSITGDGVRRSLSILQRCIPLEVHEVPSGTAVFDWTVPSEWNIRQAYINDPDGRRIIDFEDHSLHVLNYSTPVHKKVPLQELQAHLHSLPEHPDWIPYRTSYYQKNWGFCLPDRLRESLPEGMYEVCIDSTLEPGHLTYGECFLPGTSDEEILFSSHICHPSLANDNLSGVVLAVFLARALQGKTHRYGYRFLFAPGTIGSITWLAQNQHRVQRVKHGLVIACVGDPGRLTYKKSRQGSAEIDQAAAYVLERSGEDYEIVDFSPYGYDERQYCSPGFNLAVGSLTRTPHGRFPEYHTSADNLDFIQPEALLNSLNKYQRVVDVLEKNRTFRNLNPFCEPQLGKRGLYSALGGRPDSQTRQLAMLWVLNLSDGRHSLLEIARRSEVDFQIIHDVASLLESHQLLEAV